MPDKDDEKTHLVLEWIQSLNNPAGASVSASEARLSPNLDKLALDFVAAHFPDNVWQRSHPLVAKSATLTDLKSYEPGPILTNQSVRNITKLYDFRPSSAYLSEEFEAGGSSWRMLVMLHGHPNSSTTEDCSFLLERVADFSETHNVVVCAQFALAVYHYPDMNPCHFEYMHARFTNRENFHGFRPFCDTSILIPNPLGKSSPNIRPILENGRATIMAFVRVLDDPLGSLANDYFGSGSRQRTGYLGLRSDRRFPCLSSVVQMLFAISPIRQALYEVAEKTALDISKTILGELSSIFEELRDGKEPAVLSRLQRLLMTNTQSQPNPKSILLMYNALLKEFVTALEGSREAEIINRLFEGKTREHTSFGKSDCLIDVATEDMISSTFASQKKVTCIYPVIHDTSTTRDFQDLCFVITGRRRLRDLLSHHTRTVTDSAKPFIRKRKAFLALPPVLRIHLACSKSHQEVMLLDLPEVVDFAEWMDPVTIAYDSQQQWLYHLHVVVRYDQDRGLYHTFIKHGGGSDWLRFSEELVEVANPGEGEGRVCFLSYVRESLKGVILKRDIRLLETSLAKKEKKRVEERGLSLKAALRIGPSVEEETRSYNGLYEAVDIMSDESFARHPGFDITHFGNDVEPTNEAWKTVHVLPLEPFETFQRRLARFYKIPEWEVQFWLVAPPPPPRRPRRMVEWVFMEKSRELVSDFLDKSPSKAGDRKKLYIRAEPSVATSKCKVLVMLNGFDIQKGTFFGLKSVEHDPSHPVSSLVPLFVDALGWPLNAAPDIYKIWIGWGFTGACSLSIKSDWSINPLLPWKTLEQLSFTDGTCVCVLVDQGQPFKDFDPNRDYGLGLNSWGELWHVGHMKLQGGVIGSVPKDKPSVCKECGEREIARCYPLCRHIF